MTLKTKMWALIAILILGPVSVFANEIVCHKANTNKISLKFSSNNPIPNFSTEGFKIHSSYGVILIHGRNFGSSWMSIRSGGFELFYEIKLQNTIGQTIAYIHLTLHKQGAFNGYLQDAHARMELLECNFSN